MIFILFYVIATAIVAAYIWWDNRPAPAPQPAPVKYLPPYMVFNWKHDLIIPRD